MRDFHTYTITKLITKAPTEILWGEKFVSN